MDRFPEAFRRFENDVDVDKLRSYRELLYSFQWWAGQRWIGTRRQWEAFNREAERLGFDIPSFFGVRRQISSRSAYYSSGMSNKTQTYRREVVTVKGKSQNRYRDLKTGRFIKKP